MLEIMLVLSLLLVLGAIAVSRMEGVLERHQLRDVTESIRLYLNQGRLRASETGLIYQFSASNGGGDYQLAPLDSIDTNTAPMGQITGQLPSFVHFEQVDMPDLNNPNAATGAKASAATWCTPILFFPDGTSSGGAVDLVDDDNRFTRLAVRGLTAVCAVSEQKRKEMP
jgi:Tfp pilus assembly protein FimT